VCYKCGARPDDNDTHGAALTPPTGAPAVDNSRLSKGCDLRRALDSARAHVLACIKAKREGAATQDDLRAAQAARDAAEDALWTWESAGQVAA